MYMLFHGGGGGGGGEGRSVLRKTLLEVLSVQSEPFQQGFCIQD